MLHSFRLGDVVITYIPELVLPTSVRWLLEGVTREEVDACAAWMRPHYQDADGYLLQDIHTLLVQTPDHTILVDTGVGNGKDRGGAIPAFNNLDTPYLDRLAEAGVSPQDVDLVLCTHMHSDHLGWNTRREGDRWAPTFPNARHLFVEAEWDHWHRVAKEDEGVARLLADSVSPVFKAGLVDLVSADHVVEPRVRLVPSHGHSPGHVTVEVHSEDEVAALIGDTLHSPLQAAFPDVKPALDRSLEPAARARRDVLERYVGTPALVLGAHWAWPPAMVKREGDAYRVEAAGDL